MTTKAVKEALTEMLQSGTTTFNDMYNPNGVNIQQIYQAVIDSKMRCYFSPTLFSSETETTAETISRTRAIIEEILGYENPNFKGYGSSTFSYSCSKDLLKRKLRNGERTGHSHPYSCGGDQGGIRNYPETIRQTSPCLSRRTGLLRSSVGFAHGVELNEREIERLATSQVAIAHNPISNLKLASGIAPIIQLQKAGVAVGIATDSVASNNNLDMFEEGRTAALLQKMKSGDASQFPIETALKALDNRRG